MRAITEAERAALMEGIFFFCFWVWLLVVLSVCFVSGCLCGVMFLRIEERAVGMIYIASIKRRVNKEGLIHEVQQSRASIMDIVRNLTNEQRTR